MTARESLEAFRDHSVHFSSVKMDWRTPRGVFDALHAEFYFTVDGCSTDENALLERHWTEADEPLLRSWAGERVFINPPYGRQIVRWMEKAWTKQNAAQVIVGLVPSRTDARWWHDYVMGAAEIRFVKGRLKFGESATSAPFPSCIVVWRPAMEMVA